MTAFDVTINLADFFIKSSRGWFSENQKSFITRLRHDLHYRMDNELESILERMEKATTIEEFNNLWNSFYDWADLNRVRVITSE